MADAQADSTRRAKESQVPVIISLSVIPTVLSCASVALRLYTRKVLLRRVGPEDYAIIVAQLLAIGVASLNIIQVALGGLGRHIDFATDQQLAAAAKTLFAVIAVYNAAQLMTKISFLLQYRRLFPSQAIQGICTGSLVFLALWGVAQQIYTPFSCFPLQSIFPEQKSCIDTEIAYNLNAVMNMVTDFVILIIPIQPVLGLQVNRKRKAHLLVVFGFGIVACAISVVRLIELRRTKPLHDDTWDNSAIAFLSVIEISIGILCACVPTLRPLIKQIAPGLIGSSQNTSEFGRTHRLSTIRTTQTQKRKNEQESGIYIQKEVEFHSTTELRDNPSSKDPYSLRDRSSDDISIQEIEVMATAKTRKGPPYL